MLAVLININQQHKYTALQFGDSCVERGPVKICAMIFHKNLNIS